MPTNALADLQFDFFLPESLAEHLWMTSEVRAFSVDADRSLPSQGSSTGSESSFNVEDSGKDSLQAATTDRPSTPRQRHLTGETDHLERTSRDEHLPLSQVAEYDSLSTNDRWSSDEVRDNYDLQVDQPAVYHDGIVDGTRYDNHSHNQRQQTGHDQSSTWSETDVITIIPWTFSSSSVSTRRMTEPSTSPSGSGQQRQINPPLTMHYADYLREISRVSERITTSVSTPTPTTTTTTTSVGHRTRGRTRFGVTRPSSRRASLMTGGRRTLTSNSSNECGRRCPRFRPGVRRQFCHAQFGESRTIT